MNFWLVVLPLVLATVCVFLHIASLLARRKKTVEAAGLVDIIPDRVVNVVVGSKTIAISCVNWNELRYEAIDGNWGRDKFVVELAKKFRFPKSISHTEVLQLIDKMRVENEKWDDDVKKNCPMLSVYESQLDSLAASAPDSSQTQPPLAPPATPPMPPPAPSLPGSPLPEDPLPTPSTPSRRTSRRSSAKSGTPKSK